MNEYELRLIETKKSIIKYIVKANSEEEIFENLSQIDDLTQLDDNFNFRSDELIESNLDILSLYET